MGFYKNRLTTTVTATITQWRFRNAGVEGMISQSISKEYEDGEKILFMNMRFVHYDESPSWPAHWIGESQTRVYFMLPDSEQLP